MWPALDQLFWVVWISMVMWQWAADWLERRYLRSHGGVIPEPVVLVRKRLYDGLDGLHYFGTFHVPGALPMEWEISANTFASVRRGDRGRVRLAQDEAATFQKTA